MTTITIPKKLAKQGDLVVIPRSDYEEFSRWRKFIGSFGTFTPTPAQKRALKRARTDYRKGHYLTFNELKRRLDIKD